MSNKIKFEDFTIYEFEQYLSNIIFPITLNTFKEQQEYFFNSGNDDCWGFKLYKNSRGYSEFKHQRTNRCSYFFFHNVDPGQYLVCHSCDNPSCTNPKHLWLGTSKENSEDMVSKGRSISLKGEDSGSSKLTNAIIIDMFQKIEDDIYTSTKQIIIDLEISEAQLSRILNGTRWVHITNSLSHPINFYKQKINKRLRCDKQTVKNIYIDFYVNKFSKSKISQKYNISMSTLYKILTKPSEYYKNIIDEILLPKNDDIV